MNTLHNEFFSEEALRYAAECRRLARLSRHAKRVSTPRISPTPQRRNADWLSVLFGPPRKLAHRRITR
jgi:hypothetical protein